MKPALVVAYLFHSINKHRKQNLIYKLRLINLDYMRMKLIK